MKKHPTLLSVILFLSLVTISQIYAQDEQPPCGCEGNPCVVFYNEAEEITDTFNLNEPIKIVTYSKLGADESYEIKIYKPNNPTPVFTHTSTESLHTIGPTTEYTDTLGEWTVEAGTTATGFAVGLYYVIPGMPLGVVAVLSACFAGLGTNRLLRSRKENS